MSWVESERRRRAYWMAFNFVGEMRMVCLCDAILFVIHTDFTFDVVALDVDSTKVRALLRPKHSIVHANHLASHSYPLVLDETGVTQSLAAPEDYFQSMDPDAIIPFHERLAEQQLPFNEVLGRIRTIPLRYVCVA